ncbi:MAG: HEAT repeat domain-containing protein, partial [Proteobacteria bacterium]|nr:HEAT repeat domain-containing protein [Pseudomonadota bacterium]
PEETEPETAAEERVAPSPPKPLPPEPEPEPTVPPPAPTGRIRLQKKTPEWHETPIPQPPRRGGFSLDDLFDTSSSGDEVMHTPPPDEGNDLSLDDLLAGPVPQTPRAPVEAEPSAPPKDEPTHTLPEVPLRWTPPNPSPLPSPLPEDVAELLTLLPTVLPEDRSSIVSGLREHGDLQSALGSYRVGADVDLGRGVALAICELKQTSRTTVVRTLLANSDAGIRCCAAEAMGQVGTASMLTMLSRLLGDKEASVRAAAGIALARACVAHNRQSMAKNWLRPIEKDQEPLVQAAWQKAMELLES